MIFRIHISFLIIFGTILNTSGRKPKHLKETDLILPKYEEHTSPELPSDVQIATFLRQNETKLIDYVSQMDNSEISIIATTCGCKVHMNIAHNTTEITSSYTFNNNQNIEMLSHIGKYTLALTALDGSCYLLLYLSTEVGGPEALKGASKLQFKRQRKDRVLIKWEPSLVDPQSTTYCLIISEEKYYGTFCGAQADRYGVIKPGGNYRRPVAASQTVTSWRQEQDRDKYEINPNIICTGRKTQYSLRKPKTKTHYYITLFASNGQTNFTYLYGRKDVTIERKNIKPVALKDGKLNFVNMKDFDGKAVFKFKVGRRSEKSLDVYIMPCGGAVDVQITQKHEVVEAKRMIEGFGKISVSNPVIGGRYYIKIFSTNSEQLKRTSGVQLYVSSKLSSTIPLPDLPIKPILNEYVSLRTCNSVTVGWMPSGGQRVNHYCLVVKEGKIRDGYRQINQCGLENRLRKSADFATTYCKDFKQTNGKVLTHEINHLKPGRSYIIQVTVKKPRGRTISYDLLQVHTNSICDFHLE